MIHMKGVCLGQRNTALSQTGYYWKQRLRGLPGNGDEDSLHQHFDKLNRIHSPFGHFLNR
jgi:hypothetical protein